MSDEAVQRIWPDNDGHYGPFGGRFVPEVLMGPLLSLDEAWSRLRASAVFWQDLLGLLATYAGRPTPLYEAMQLAAAVGGRVRFLLKREDLGHTGSSAIIGALGQALIARAMRKEYVVCESGSGQEGIAAAAACARLGLGCTVYMGAMDAQRQELNVAAIQALGGRVVPIRQGRGTLRDAAGAALRHWARHPEEAFYVAYGALGPHPYPLISRDLGSIIGVEAQRQVADLTKGGRPHAVVANANDALNIFYPFIGDANVKLVSVHAGGRDPSTADKHAALITHGVIDVLHGQMTRVLEDDDGNLLPTHTLAAGLGDPVVGPELALLHHVDRVYAVAVSDEQAVEAWRVLAHHEGIIASLESACAVACGALLAQEMEADSLLLVCISGRGDNDLCLARSLSTDRNVSIHVSETEPQDRGAAGLVGRPAGMFSAS